ncbi:MAG: HYR domain-containing protein, partial [Saprospiraceae bacterium]
FLKDSLGFATATPQVNDACGVVTSLTYTDTQVLYNCDTTFTKIISRRWQANDASGNTSACIQRIKLHQHTADEMLLPPDVTISCPDKNVDPAVTGQPFIMVNGRRYNMVNSSICEISAFYKDYPLRLACGNVRVRRLWEFLDFCTNEVTGPFLQNIYLFDETGPIVNCPDPLVVTVAADTTCHGMVDLPDALLDDVCARLFSFQAFWQENGLTKNFNGSLANFLGNDLTDVDTMGVLGLAKFPMGTTPVTYVAQDSCGNLGDCTFNLTVADMVPPVARCDTFSTLQFLSNGTLAIAAQVLDNGSADACGVPLSFKAILLDSTLCHNDTLWADTLRFCCQDISQTLDAVLRVYDIPAPPGAVSPSFGIGHFSDCAVQITLADQHPPTCIAPPSVTVGCKNFDPTLASYGSLVSVSCAVDSMAIEADYAMFDSICKQGTLTRIFKVFEDSSSVGTCTQAITVNNFQDYYVKFPNDVIVTLCDGTSNYGEPVMLGMGCEDFDVDFTDQVFTAVPDACFKIERTWKITNRCTYDSLVPIIVVPNPTPSTTANHPTNLPGPVVSRCGIQSPSPWKSTIVKIYPSDPAPGTDYCTFWGQAANGYQYKQIIKVIDSKAPSGTYTVPTCSNQNFSSLLNPQQLWNEPYWVNPSNGSQDLCEQPTELSIVGTDVCFGSDIGIEYLLFLDLDGNGTQETVINSVVVGSVGLGWNNVLFNNNGTPNYAGGTPRQFDERPVPSNRKFGFAIEETVSGNTKTARVRWNTQHTPGVFVAPELPHGMHKIKWQVTDGCGNNKEYEYPFTVSDCKKPTVACKSTLNVTLPPAGAVSITVPELMQSSADDCSATSTLKHGISKCSATSFPFDIMGNPASSITLGCFELDSQCVKIWAKDEAGNAGFCQTTVLVQDNADNCIDPGQLLSGWVKTELGDGVEESSIEIEADTPPFPPAGSGILTDSFGHYVVPLIPLSASTRIVPKKDDNPLNGVTTFDLVLISKHILGIETFNSPYKMLSADANRSGSITTFDIVEIRKLILGIYTKLPNNKSWRFVDSSFVFPNPLNPFQTASPERIAPGLPPPYNFVGMKVGDVNNTVVPNLLAPAEERFSGVVYFDINASPALANGEGVLREGEIFELKFTASQPLEGCQFTLETDGLEILETIPGENMDKENFAHFPQKSSLTMAWEAGGQASFGLKMRAQKTGPLREMLHISDAITKAEAYAYNQQSAISNQQSPINNQQSAISNPQSTISNQRIALRFGNPASAFDLFQNQPNPFAHKTAITFQLPEASPATLSIFDSNGRVLWSQSGDWPAGLNTVDVDLAGRSAAGVLYYQLETPTQNAVRKMVRI